MSLMQIKRGTTLDLWIVDGFFLLKKIDTMKMSKSYV